MPSSASWSALSHLAPLKNKTVSSANIMIFPCMSSEPSSLIYMMKKSGPRT
ncbi:unnamed protein product, partial [Nesidiocoris tenuis]